MQQWLFECSYVHAICKADENERSEYLPTRLIDVNAPVRLVEGVQLERNVRYMTLSHCWGKLPLYTLRTDSFDEFRRSIPLAKLTKCFQDAIQCTQGLGIRYLWIDSLCILQDSTEDWQHESLDMQSVYSNSWCTIAATAFLDGQQGLFTTRKPAEVFDLPSVVASGWPYGQPKTYHCVSPSHWKRNIDDAPLCQRAWVLQERLLSPRVLHFAENQIFWKCFSMQASETFPRGLPISLFGETLDKVNNHQGLGGFNHLKPYENWDRVVETYSNRSLTKETDKLVAISGLARVNSCIREIMAKPLDAGSRYLAGVWKDKDFLRQLCWSVRSIDITHVSLRPRTYLAPSWTWACLNGQVAFPNLESMEWYKCALCKDAYASPSMANELGSVRSGYIRMEGLLRHGVLLYSAASLPWQSSSYQLRLNGKIFDIELRPDACQPTSKLADLSVPPLDTAFWPSAEAVSSPHQCEMSIYLFPLRTSSSGRGGHRCALTGLWLRPTGRVKGEFTRLGLFVAEVDIQYGIWGKWRKLRMIAGDRDNDDSEDVQDTAYSFLSMAFPAFIPQNAPEIKEIDTSNDGRRVEITIV